MGLRRLLKKVRSRKDDVQLARRRSHIGVLTRLTNEQSQPNINELWALVKDIDILRLNTKNFGYALAKRLAEGFEERPVPTAVGHHDLVSKASTQADVESPWFRYWCHQLKIPPIYHRKLWEFAFFFQILSEQDVIKPGASGVGFGCGEEPIASLLARMGCRAKVTDLHPELVRGRGWQETGQHTTALQDSFHPEIVDKEVFFQQVSHQYVDMNHLPRFAEPYDFCWSICAMEHLGSIEKGLQFVENSLDCLRPGGVAVHTTEFNYLSNDQTLDNWPTVLFRRRDFEELKRRVEAKGHRFLGPDFDTGHQPMDLFIDVPPYAYDAGELGKELSGWASHHPQAHLKLALDGFASTCFGIAIQKAV